MVEGYKNIGESKESQVAHDVAELSSGPFRELKDKLHYEPAHWDETSQNMTIGNHVFRQCKYIDRGGLADIYKAVSPDGLDVVLKVDRSDRLGGYAGLDEARIFTETKYGEEEKLVGIDRDEAALTLIRLHNKGSRVVPELRVYGQLPDGKRVVVSEFIPGKKAMQAAYKMRRLVMPDDGKVLSLEVTQSAIAGNNVSISDWEVQNPSTPYSTGIPLMRESATGDTDERKQFQKEQADLENRINCFKTMLLLVLRDAVESFVNMHDARIFNKDLKMADYILHTQTAKGLINPVELEKKWRGVFIDWGNFQMRIDKIDRPTVAYRHLLAFTMRQVIRECIIGVFNQYPPIPKMDQLKEILDDNSRAYMTTMVTALENIRRTFEEFLQITDKEVVQAQPDFDQKCAVIFKQLNKEATQIGLQTRFEYPLK